MNQFLGFFPQIFCFSLFIPNFPFLYYLLYFYYSLLFWFYFIFLLFLLLLLLQLSLLHPLLFSILFQTSCHFYLSYFSVNFRIVAYQLWYSQDYTLLLTTNEIYLCSLPVFFIEYIYLYSILDQSLLVEHSIHISHVYGSFNFLQLKFLLPH